MVASSDHEIAIAIEMAREAVAPLRAAGREHASRSGEHVLSRLVAGSPAESDPVAPSRHLTGAGVGWPPVSAVVAASALSLSPGEVEERVKSGLPERDPLAGEESVAEASVVRLRNAQADRRRLVLAVAHRGGEDHRGRRGSDAAGADDGLFLLTQLADAAC